MDTENRDDGRSDVEGGSRRDEAGGRLVPGADVPFDEFERACNLVESYFGGAIDAVALESPVSRPQLVAVLARAQLSGRLLGTDELRERGELVYDTDEESVLWLDGEFWDELADAHGLEPAERRSAREIHRRLAVAVDGDGPPGSRDAFVFVELPPPVG